MISFWLLMSAIEPAPPPPDEPCTVETGCVTTGASQLFAVADTLFAQGDVAGAEQILLAITQDKHVELRAEAWFRLAALRDAKGDLAGSADALRRVLIEQPEAQRARLELARILGKMGDPKAARDTLEAATTAGLPPEVEQTVRQFSTSLAPARRRGLSIELAGGPDSNLNRATSSQFIDTIIAPFELDPDARRRSGIGFSASIQGWTQSKIGPLDLLSRATLNADLSDKSRFNDLQLSVDSGPRWLVPKGRIRPSFVVERHWFGGRGYAFGLGAQLGWQASLGPRTSAEIGLARVHQRIDRNRDQSGWRTNLNLSVNRSVSSATTLRAGLRWSTLDARAKAESIESWGVDGLAATRLGGVTVFGEAGLTWSKGKAPIFLFGERRRDRRIDLAAGAVFNRLSLGGFAPLVRLSHTNSEADIVLYDFKRTRLDIGFSGSF